jgi:hypothetical protein
MDHPLMLSQTLINIMEIFDIEDEKLAKARFEKIIDSLYEENNLEINLSLKENINTSFAFLRAIYPTDDFEKVCAASAVVCEILGLKSLRRMPDAPRAVKLLEQASNFKKYIYEKRMNVPNILTKKVKNESYRS